MSDQNQNIQVFDQVQAFFRKQNDIAVVSVCDDGEEADNDNSTGNKIMRSDQLWMFLFSLTAGTKF